jgi:hypothetical protein
MPNNRGGKATKIEANQMLMRIDDYVVAAAAFGQKYGCELCCFSNGNNNCG